MVGRIKVALVGAAALFALILAVGTLKADDEKCDTCAAVKTALESARCEGCKNAEKPCADCAKRIKTLEARLACKDCGKSGSCGPCERAIKDAKCKLCAAKKLIADRTFCGEKCEKAGKACPKCEEERTVRSWRRADQSERCHALPLVWKCRVEWSKVRHVGAARR